MLLQAVNIHKVYRQAENTLHILKGIDVGIQEGEIVSIVGPSGAGKSTLLHILGGLDMPNDGHVNIDGEDLYKLNDVKRAKVRNGKIGFVFQFYHLLPEFTVLENVLLPVIVGDRKVTIKQVEIKAIDLLEKVGLQHRIQHRPYQLSGGEQQRVAIARALINEPKILLCDEPTGNLDSQTGKSIIDLLFDLNRRAKQSLVIVTHDEQIARLSGRVIHMRDGKLV
jgi:lipoprotein-releasing system ATP-binding protein